MLGRRLSLRTSRLLLFMLLPLSWSCRTEPLHVFTMPFLPVLPPAPSAIFTNTPVSTYNTHAQLETFGFSRGGGRGVERVKNRPGNADVSITSNQILHPLQ